MSERIHTLMKECGIPTRRTSIDGNGYEYYTPNFEVEKLIKLIIQECVDIANKQFSAATGLDDRDCWTSNEIKQHFGVEE